jgi:tetratricopeptide (TPR) repeat protein
MHLNEILLGALERGEVSERFVLEILMEHVSTGCAACVGAIGAHRADPDRARADLLALARNPVARIGRRRKVGERQLRADEREARRWVREIVGLEPEKRYRRIYGAYSRFRGALFGVLLLEEARRAIPEDPTESLSLAEMALLSCKRTSKEDPDPEVKAPALAVRGNAKRALGRLREAETDLLEARRLLHAPAFADPAFPAELDSYLGSLRKDQRRLEEAERHLRRAGTLYRLLEEPEKSARVLLKLGAVQFRAGDFDAAVEASERALGLLGEDSEAWLRGYAHYDRAYFLHATGKLDEAEQELVVHDSLIAAAGDGLDFRVVWLRARIAWSRGEPRKAGKLFEEALRRATTRGIPYDTSLLCLELALVRLADGRTGEVKKLAAEALQVFAEEEVEPEVRAALALVEGAARREALTQEAIERAVAALRRAQQALGP